MKAIRNSDALGFVAGVLAVCAAASTANSLTAEKTEGSERQVKSSQNQRFFMLNVLWFKPNGEPTWRWSLSPLLYPTHGIGPYLHMTGDRFAEVTAYGVSGDVPPQAEPNRRWLEVAMLRSDRGCLFKLLNSFCNAHPGGHYLSFYGDRGSFETARGDRGSMCCRLCLSP